MNNGIGFPGLLGKENFKQKIIEFTAFAFFFFFIFSWNFIAFIDILGIRTIPRKIILRKIICRKIILRKNILRKISKDESIFNSHTVCH